MDTSVKSAPKNGLKTTCLVVVSGLLVLALAVIVGFVFLALQIVRPVDDLTRSLGTQVAQVMHPTPTIIPDPVTIIHEVRTLARLETIQYSVEKVITAETRQGTFGFLFGDKLLLVAHGRVIAGIDLARLEADDMWLDSGVLYMRLPEPEIFVVALDNDKSYVYDRDTGLLTYGDVNLETLARRAAEDEVEKAAVADGILVIARQNAENYLSRLVRDLGYPEVIFVSPDESSESGETPIPPLPEETPILVP